MPAGFVEPTPIQAQAIPSIMEGLDVMGTAQTGTGKTAAFILPLLNRLIGKKRGRIRALIIAPTRELVEQIQ
jgi:ATP-dependent RNA helicase RhlE